MSVHRLVSESTYKSGIVRIVVEIETNAPMTKDQHETTSRAGRAASEAAAAAWNKEVSA